MRKGKAKKRRKRMLEMLDLPEEIDLVTPRMTMVGRENLLIENIGEVISVSDEKIRVETVLGIACIEGKELRMAEFSNERAFVCGILTSWRYEEPN